MTITSVEKHLYVRYLQIFCRICDAHCANELFGNWVFYTGLSKFYFFILVFLDLSV